MINPDAFETQPIGIRKEDFKHANTQEIVLCTAHGDDAIETGKFAGDFPYVILADGVTQVEFQGKVYERLGKLAADEAILDISGYLKPRFEKGMVNDEYALIEVLKRAFTIANQRALTRRTSFANSIKNGSTPPINFHLGATTATMALLWEGSNTPRRWYVIGIGNGYVFRIPRVENFADTDFMRDEDRRSRRRTYNADDFIGTASKDPIVQIADYQLGDNMVLATDGLEPLFMAIRHRGETDPRKFLADRIARNDWNVACNPEQNVKIRRSDDAGAWKYGDDATFGIIKV